jgi:hypothetical protein
LNQRFKATMLGKQQNSHPSCRCLRPSEIHVNEFFGSINWEPLNCFLIDSRGIWNGWRHNQSRLWRVKLKFSRAWNASGDGREATCQWNAAAAFYRENCSYNAHSWRNNICFHFIDFDIAFSKGPRIYKNQNHHRT